MTSKYDCIDVTCPKCLAPVGIPCVTLTGRFYNAAHTSRQKLSRQGPSAAKEFDEEMEREGAAT